MSDVLVPIPATDGKHRRLLNARTREGNAREGYITLISMWRYEWECRASCILQPSNMTNLHVIIYIYVMYIYI